MSLREAGILTTATTRERKAVKALCEANHLDFTKFFFRQVFDEEFIVAPHHIVIANVLERVFSGEITRLIINVPPGYTKTLLAVVMFIARGLAKYPSSRYIHASFSDKLVIENSGNIQDIIKSPEFQSLWPAEIRSDKSNKGLWRTTSQGGMLAAPAAGSITGFRAGRMGAGFTGAMIIDDALKPDDARSPTKRTEVNNRFTNTLRSRLAKEDVPMIVIGQMLHKMDLTNYLLSGGSGDYWHHLLLPVLTDRSARYPDKHTHGIPILHDLPNGPLWPEKHNEAQIEVLKADKSTYAAQYNQSPVTAGGILFDVEKLQEYTRLPNLEYRMIYGDTAMKDKEKNDYSVFACWGKGRDGNIYLIDIMRGKWLAPELKKVAEAFYLKHKAQDDVQMGRLRAMKVEDKASGTGLIQSIKNFPILGIPRSKDKIERGNDCAPWVESGMVYVPVSATWKTDFINEVSEFPKGDFDDQVDTFMDAIDEMLGSITSLLDVL